MKVGFVTICDNGNFGTYLQIFAFQQTIFKLGFKPTLIQYFRKCMTLASICRVIFYKNDSIFKKVLSMGYAVYEYLGYQAKGRKFIKNNIFATKRFVGAENVVDSLVDFDIYVTGSDQVWNSIYNNGVDEVMYLGFLKSATPRFSYAASFGMTQIPNEEKNQVIGYLSQYKALSVRENAAETLLNHLGFNTVNHVLDPTLLLSREEYLALAEESDIALDDDYLLIYSVEQYQNEFIFDVAKQIAHEKKMKIVSITPYGFRKKIPGADSNYIFASVNDFVNLISKAAFVVCSSFHGTVFSIIFRKDFISISPKKFNSRTLSLLTQFELDDRLLPPNTSIDIDHLSVIDWNKIEKILEAEKANSLAFLKQNLVMEHDK